MKALFLNRRYVEKSKKSGKSMVILDVYQLPELKSDGSGELVGGGTKTYFITDPAHFEIGKKCKLGDVINLRMEYDERFDRGVPVETEVLIDSEINLLELIA